MLKPLTATNYIYKMTLMHDKKRIQSELSGDFKNMFLNMINIDQDNYSVPDDSSQISISSKFKGLDFGKMKSQKSIASDILSDRNSLDGSDSLSNTNVSVQSGQVTRRNDRKVTIIKYLQDLKEKKPSDGDDVEIRLSNDGMHSVPVSPNKPRSKKNWNTLKQVVKQEVYVRRSKRTVTRNNKSDFKMLNEVSHQRKLLWNDPEGISITVRHLKVLKMFIFSSMSCI